MEKFKVIFNNEKVFGLKDCPVQVEKYNILFNNSTERNVIQLKLRNRAEKTVKSVYLEIDCFDDTKDNLGTLKDIVYLNVNAVQGATFGSRQAVNTDFSIVSSINIKIAKVAFDDETIWRNESGAYLREFPQPTNGSTYFGELYGQYKREAEKINADFTYAYGEKEDFWQCSCGQNNDYANKACFACHTEKNKLKAISDLQYLNEENQKYLIAEEQERQRLEAQRLEEEAERQRVEEQQKKEAEEKAKQQQEASEKLKKRLIKLSVSAAIFICVLIVGAYIISYMYKLSKNNKTYNEAIALEENGDYDGALFLLETLDTDKAKEKIISINEEIYNETYSEAVALEEAGDYNGALSLFETLDTNEAEEQIFSIRKKVNLNTNTVLDGNLYHTVGIKSDGTIIMTGVIYYNKSDVENWTDIISVSVGHKNIAGLKNDGTVVVAGDNEYGQCNVENWNNISAISVGDLQTVGLKNDGTVIAIGYNKNGQCDVEGWNNIIAISNGSFGSHTVGLKNDGTVVAVGNNDYGQCDVEDWSDIVAISAGYLYTVGLKKNGTVVATGYNKDAQCNVGDWNDIIAISAGYNHTVGLKTNGTVVAVGDNYFGQCDIKDWADIFAISAADFFTVGLKKDGTVLEANSKYHHNGQSSTDDWKDIMIY